MNTDKHLHFIKTKIETINNALFHCHTNSLLTIPTSIVNTMRVDDDGHIYIFMPRPQQLLSQFEKEFPVGLNYFKKGIPHFVNIYGKARIINDPEELMVYDLTFEEMERALKEELFLKVKILKADYYEKDVEKKTTLLYKAKVFIYGLLAWTAPEEKSYDFNSPGLHGYGF